MVPVYTTVRRLTLGSYLKTNMPSFLISICSHFQGIDVPCLTEHNYTRQLEKEGERGSLKTNNEMSKEAGRINSQSSDSIPYTIFLHVFCRELNYVVTYTQHLCMCTISSHLHGNFPCLSHFQSIPSAHLVYNIYCLLTFIYLY